eukprot:TRINITY_DN61809_c0_g1_i1.p1 TRINITY_DN61809_c0_g1~~TRINITY_DN61809_c0_g1_i1.p1  ORF type:complete len:764 (+),score=157.88 TRINITY_DN61809_c0_g1_i1:39-2294(+)
MGNVCAATNCGLNASPPSTGLVENANAVGRPLLEEYTLGETLGEGAFGVVKRCRDVKEGKEFACKMVDKVESDMVDILQEKEMLDRVDHPNIVKLHGVYFEKCFVCLVMDKYSGGDLVSSLIDVCAKNGGKPWVPHDTIHAFKQMASAVEHMHSRDLVHRDIKGDNYLLDRPELADKRCRVVLTDFGTVTELPENGRLKQSSGTKEFWSPEFYARDYGRKVDIWALGVVFFGLFTGRFPFKDKEQVLKKEVKVPARIPEEGKDLILRALERDEKARLTAKETLHHEWMAQEAGSKHDLHAEDEKDATGRHMNESKPHAGIKNRRELLLERLVDSNLRKPSERRTVLVNHTVDNFKVKDPRAEGGELSYSWTTAESLKSLPSRLSRASVKDTPTMDFDVFANFLREHRIDTCRFGFGEAKSVDELMEEVQNGSSRIMLDASTHKKIVRVVDVVALRISKTSADGTRRLLIEAEEKFSDGRSRATMLLPGSKKYPYENARQAAQRVLSELDLDIKAVSLNFDAFEYQEQETTSPSFPDVRTVYRKEIVDGELSAASSAAKDYVITTKAGITKNMKWMTFQEAERNRVKLSVPKGEVSALVEAPIGMDVAALSEYLTDEKVALSNFGTSGAMSLEKFSEQLIRGEVQIVRAKNGQATVISETVVLELERLSSGRRLRCAGGQDDSELPSVAKRPDENVFLVARQFLESVLRIDGNYVDFVGSAKEFCDTTDSSQLYGGLPFMERKLLLQAKVQS